MNDLRKLTLVGREEGDELRRAVLSACFDCLDFSILPLEITGVLLTRQCLVHKSLRPVSLVDSCAVEFGWSFDDGTNLGK